MGGHHVRQPPNPREELNLRRRCRTPRHVRYTTRALQRTGDVPLFIFGREHSAGFEPAISTMARWRIGRYATSAVWRKVRGSNSKALSGPRFSGPLPSPAIGLTFHQSETLVSNQSPPAPKAGVAPRDSSQRELSARIELATASVPAEVHIRMCLRSVARTVGFEPTPFGFGGLGAPKLSSARWSPRSGLNREPRGSEPRALPIELQGSGDVGNRTRRFFVQGRTLPSNHPRLVGAARVEPACSRLSDERLDRLSYAPVRLEGVEPSSPGSQPGAPAIRAASLVHRCEARDLNPHTRRHQFLRLACLPFHQLRVPQIARAGYDPAYPV